MNERLALTGSGSPTVFAGSQALHSQYNPQAEAERYVASLTIREGVRFFILIEPGLGYAVPVLRKRYPQARIIALHVSDFFDASVPPMLRADAAWCPGRGVPVQRFLEREIPDIEGRSIGLIEWRPALDAYGEDYLRLLSEAVDFIKRLDANARTVRGFGRRWVRNVFRNLRLMRNVLTLPQTSIPLIVAGAGPSLEETATLIREKQAQGYGVLAASSSLEALLARGIGPNLVISTDGGAWASLHLFGAWRAHREGLPLALGAAITAAIPSQCGDLPVLVISDGSLWQALALQSAALPFIALPARGTVTAAALDLAFTLTRGEVSIAGTDLGHRDMCTHARPYSFNRLLEDRASRFQPFYSQTFVRSEAIKASGSHGIYAAWFKQRLDAYPQRLRALGDNNPLFKSLKAPRGPSNPGGPPNPGEPPNPGGPSNPEGPASFPRGRIIGAGIYNAEKALRNLTAALSGPAAAVIVRELAPLLLPGREDPSPEELKAEIRSLVKASGRTDGETGDG
ncbi:MAG: DUF115 domain-containing protein [Spirochaetaceae bacterium]|jgi:hypothetical protein|nr:DUF115 domain-containing protein [Spirochaetaceae bacterium]